MYSLTAQLGLPDKGCTIKELMGVKSRYLAPLGYPGLLGLMLIIVWLWLSLWERKNCRLILWQLTYPSPESSKILTYNSKNVFENQTEF